MKKFRRLAALLLAGVLALAVLSGCGGSRFEREVEETVLKYVNAAMRETQGEGAREFKNDPALRQKAYEMLGRIDPESGLIDSEKAFMLISRSVSGIKAPSHLLLSRRRNTAGAESGWQQRSRRTNWRRSSRRSTRC